MNEQRIEKRLRQIMATLGKDELLFLRDAVVPLLLAAALAPKLLPPARAPKLLPEPWRDDVPPEERDLVNAVRACKGLVPLYRESSESSDRGQLWVARCEAAGAGYSDLHRQSTRVPHGG